MRRFLSLSLACGIAFTSSLALAQNLSPETSSKVSTASHLLIDSVAKSYCTAFAVTNDGYMLTALHCVRRCLDAQGLIEKASGPFFGLSDLSVSTRSQNTQALCPELSVPQLGAKSVTVVATGSALSNFDAKFFGMYSRLYQELKAKGFDSRANDFAVLKIQVAQPISCLKIATQSPSAGQTLWAVGYPLPKTSGVAPSLKLSAGSLYATARDSAYYKSQPEPLRSWVEALYSDPSILYSSAQTAFGQSGGAIVDQAGAVIGVASGFTSTLVNGIETHELVASSTSKILSSIPTALSQKLVTCTH